MSQDSLPVTPDMVREFCSIAEQNDLAELTVTYDDFRLTIKRTAEPPPAPQLVVAPGISAAPAVPLAATPPPPAAPPPAPSRDNVVAVTSPLAGVFYRSPSPGAPPFVEVGDVVSPGQTLCIIEAMKLMNQIPAETHGRVQRILVENSAVVEAGQEIVLIERL